MAPKMSPGEAIDFPHWVVRRGEAVWKYLSQPLNWVNEGDKRSKSYRRCSICGNLADDFVLSPLTNYGVMAFPGDEAKKKRWTRMATPALAASATLF